MDLGPAIMIVLSHPPLFDVVLIAYIRGEWNDVAGDIISMHLGCSLQCPS